MSGANTDPGTALGAQLLLQMREMRVPPSSPRHRRCGDSPGSLSPSSSPGRVRPLAEAVNTGYQPAWPLASLPAAVAAAAAGLAQRAPRCSSHRGRAPRRADGGHRAPVTVTRRRGLTPRPGLGPSCPPRPCQPGCGAAGLSLTPRRQRESGGRSRARLPGASPGLLRR